MGLAFGSFINAYVWRSYQSQKKKNKDKLSVWNGRSICPECRHTLSAIDLIPIVSWIMLGGKCRYCKKPISIQYPLVELSTTLLFILSYVYWPLNFTNEGITLFVFWLIFLVGFMMLMIYDFRWRLLPNRIVMPLVFLAIVQLVVQLIFFNAGLSLLLSAFWGILFSAGLFYGIFIISNGAWIGGGDVKLAIALGILLGGPMKVLLMIFLASFVGSIISITLIATKKLKQNSLIPFGPLLILSTIVCYLFGTGIINWYKNFIF